MIQISPKKKPLERTTHIPFNKALRWWTEFTDDSKPPVVSVFVTQKAYVRICLHAGSDLDNEVGGWLLGKWRKDTKSGEEFIVVDAVLPAVHTLQGSAFLTFTQDSQVAMYGIMEERYPQKELVGWYHTHPRMGVFLSSHDVWLHNNFFPKPWHVALVIEPHSNTAGFFIKDQQGVLDPRRYYGFYEINNNHKREVVHWNNMYRNPPLDVEGD